MPWKETWAVEERKRFVLAARKKGVVMTELCAEFGISRDCGYKWLRRYAVGGLEGLKDRSRAPHEHGRAHEAAVVEAVWALHDQYGWGAKKLQRKLAEARPQIELPAVSTIHDWLARDGRTDKRRRRRRSPPGSRPLTEAKEPNAVWATDFKGWFRTGDGERCDPLTLSDLMSRYLLCAQAVDRPDYEHVRPVFDAAFCEFGLPLFMRSDNGPPFASTAAGGLSKLSLWWIKLGIRPERIRPAKPQQNGCHERMHRTLDDETADPPAETRAEQQTRFDDFRKRFNHERPHEGIDFKYPASLYKPSPRSYPCALRDPEYGADCQVRKVRSNGEIKWRGELVFVSQVLDGEPVGIEPTEDGQWRVRYAHIDLGFIDLERRRLDPPVLPRKPACGDVDNARALPTSPQAQQPQQPEKM